jgi:hypothetical protein
MGQTPPLANVAAITDSLSAVISREQDCRAGLPDGLFSNTNFCKMNPLKILLIFVSLI